MGEEAVEPLSWRIYAGLGVLWFLSLQVLSWGGVQGDAPYRWISTMFFAVLGGVCWWNGRECGAIHCRISGPGYLVVALVSALSAIGIVEVTLAVLMSAFLAIAAVSYGIEWYVERDRAQPS